MGALLKKVAGDDLGTDSTLAIVEADGIMVRTAQCLYDAVVNGWGIGQRQAAELLLSRLRDFGVPVMETVAEAIAAGSPDQSPMVPLELNEVRDDGPGMPEDDGEPMLSPESEFAISRFMAKLEIDSVMQTEFAAFIGPKAPPWIEQDGGVQRTVAPLVLWIGRDAQTGMLMAKKSHTKFGGSKRIPLR